VTTMTLQWMFDACATIDLVAWLLIMLAFRIRQKTLNSWTELNVREITRLCDWNEELAARERRLVAAEREIEQTRGKGWLPWAP
jgi:hypothetical protein